MSFASLLQWASPALPVGGYTWSRGLETAVERGVVVDATTAHGWIEGLLESVVVRVDAPLVARAFRSVAQGDHEDLRRWAWRAVAMRETHELRAESTSTARALLRLATDLQLLRRDDFEPETWIALSECQVASFATIAHAVELTQVDAVRAHLWIWLESSVAAAVKLVPLGQTDGQRILLRLGRRLDALADEALALPDHELGALAHGLAITSALHETQHTRLFRS